MTKSALALAMTFAISLTASAQVDSDTGARLFFNHCAACHGEDGEGSGPVAAAMRVGVPNLRTLAMRNGGSFPADTLASYIDGRALKAAHGDRQMPVWGDVFRGPDQGTAERTVRRRIRALVAFIEELQYR